VFPFPLLHPVEFVEVVHLARDLHLDFRRVKQRDAPDSAFPGQNGLGKGLAPVSVRADRAHSRDHYATFHISLRL
jgi:hypothetical protein